MDVKSWIFQLTWSQRWTYAFWICFVASVALMLVDTSQCLLACSGLRFAYTSCSDGWRNEANGRSCAVMTAFQVGPHLLLGAQGTIKRKWVPLAVYGTLLLLWICIDAIFWIFNANSLVIVEILVLLSLACVTFRLAALIRKEQRRAKREAARQVPTAVHYHTDTETVVSYID